MILREEWRTIPGHPNYEVSNAGRVRSLPRYIEWRTRWGTIGQRWHKGGMIHADPHHTGYMQIKLGGPRIFRLHQLVAAAFLGPCPEGMVVSHSDDDKRNNQADNLEYMTNPENVKRAYRTGRLSNKGRTNGKAVLTDEVVRLIRSFPPSVSAPKVARALGCKSHNVHQVRSGAWSHVA